MLSFVRRWLVLAGVLLMWFAARAEAQETPECSNCGSIVVYAVPDPVTKPPNAGPFTATFVVRNTFSSGLTVTPVCQAGTGLTCGTVTPSSVFLGPGGHDSVRVQYTTGANPTTLTLQAWHDDEMIPQNPYTGTQTVLSPVAPSLALRNRPDQLERGLCVTAGAGEAAWQCGDLLVAHGMPGYRTLGRDRSLTLVYNSATAAPRPTVAVAVTQPAWVLPDSVYAELRVGPLGGSKTLKASARYASWGGQGIPITRQIVLGYNADTASTGIYDYTLVVRNRFASEVTSDSVSGQLLVVNRSASRYGAGWELAGVEWIQYYDGGAGWPHGKMLWVGGDGSARIYTPVGGSIKWVADSGAFRDTLELNFPTYTRRLRHGAYVQYNNFGRHLKTVNRVGQETLFYWNSVTADKLDSIFVPPSGTGGKYVVGYSGNAVSSLTDPGGRVLGLTVTSGKLVTLTDPDAVSTAMTYDGSGRMLTRANRLGYPTTYEYTGGLRVTRASVPYGPTGDSTAVTNYTPWDHNGVCIGTCGSPLATTDTFFVRTKVDGPRADVADTAAFYVDRWGAPTRTVNAIGVSTRIKRQSVVYPALVTEVLYPNNRIVRMTYDTTVGRGNLKMVRDSTSHLSNGLPTKATAYTYGSGVAPDSPTQVADALGRTITYAYNGMGILDSTIDARGHVTAFRYDSTPGSPTRGVIRSITERSVQTWEESSGTADDTLTTDVVRDHVTRYGYDAKGNIDSIAAPHGVVSVYKSDTFGRTYRSWNADSMLTTLEFDALNRVVKQRQYTTAQPDSVFSLALASMVCDTTQVTCSNSDARAFAPSLPSELLTEYRQNAVGLDTLIDPLAASRKFAYDARMQVRREIDGHNNGHETTTNAAALVTKAVARRGDQVFHAYDVLGRLTQTRFVQWTDANGVTIPGDTITVTYDSLGNQLTSVNRIGTVTRTYFADGSPRSKIMFRPTQFGGIADTLRYNYNAAGQRTLVVHGPDSSHYVYNPSTGDLDTVRTKWGAGANHTSRVSFSWDALGRRRDVKLPRDIQLSYRYDKLGTLRRLKSSHAWNPLVRSNFRFKYAATRLDPLGRILEQRTACNAKMEEDAYGACESGSTSLDRTMRYNWLGMLVSNQTGLDADSLGYDRGGNILRRRPTQVQTWHTYTVDSTTNRLVKDSLFAAGQAWVTTFVHDTNGARIREVINGITVKEYAYDGLGRINGLGMVLQPGNQYVMQVDMCLYDGEGQMVKPCDNLVPLLSYDGANVTGTYGNGLRWTFVHGPGTDDPLLGMLRDGVNPPRLLYWVTDGNGRQFTVADSSGNDPAQLGMDDGGATGYWGWQWVGATRRSFGFAASRTGPHAAPTLSVFRNRLYDQSTGRWTQEDPIGVAGGVNLYQFNNNNPASHTDPFGLSADGGIVLAVVGLAAAGYAIYKGVMALKDKKERQEAAAAKVSRDIENEDVEALESSKAEYEHARSEAARAGGRLATTLVQNSWTQVPRRTVTVSPTPKPAQASLPKVPEKKDVEEVGTK